MNQSAIDRLLEELIPEPGLRGTSIEGLELFHVVHPIECTPAVYDPSIVAISRGSKEAIIDGQSMVYDRRAYLCCTMSMPVEAGTPKASPRKPLMGVRVTLDSALMREVAIETENADGAIRRAREGAKPQGIALARWDESFASALYRLLEIADKPVESAVLGKGRLRELYFAVLQGEAGHAARRAFGVGNEIARAIEYLSTELEESVNVDELAGRVGMSRATFHRKFKEATQLSPIQFLKSIRLNRAAMKIASGMRVSEAAMEVGYASSSQFSREFKRKYGQSPKLWGLSQRFPGT